ncbi:hypothetical protein NMY22_g3816 [Coprinellus aureogranulatus]|nr:hypothetical protein NMY22_g3816 [Coprinellus aureogranulatus]
MPEFGITEAQIVGLFMESVFYGIYLITFFSCMGVLLMKDGHLKEWSAINKMMVTSALLMLIFGSMDVAFGLRQNLDAFVYQFAKGVDPADEFSRISKWLNVMKFANYSVQTFIGDGILLYRCFVIYNRKWYIVIFPALMWLATLATSTVTCVIEASIGNGNLNQTQFEPFITSTLVLTLSTNLITTGLIVYRIYNIQARAANHTTHTSTSYRPYSRLIRTLIECGAMYTASIVVLFACYLADSNAILGVSNSVVQIIVSYPTTHRSIPLHELRIKTVTTTVCDPPDQFQPAKSRVTRQAVDEESLDDLTDMEKGGQISPSNPESHRIDARAM